MWRVWRKFSPLIIFITLAWGILPWSSWATATTDNCPPNAWCGSKALKAQAAWAQASKAPPAVTSWANLGKKYGFPIEVWAVLAKDGPQDGRTAPADLPSNFIGWDSPCRHHQQSPKLILKGHSFVQNLKQLAPHLVSGSAQSIDGQGKIHTWAIPAGETPILLDGTNLIFTLAFEGQYLHLKINEQGQLTSGKWQLQGKRPREVKCPPALAQKFSPLKNEVALYQEGFCKEIWNLATHSFQTLLFAWACD